jgi:hypothetical protein
MDIKIVPREPYYRRPRNSGWGRFLAQFAFYLASLIPMCIVAWRIDLLGLGGQQQPQVIVKHVPQPAPGSQQRRSFTPAPKTTPTPKPTITPTPRTSEFQPSQPKEPSLDLTTEPIGVEAPMEIQPLADAATVVPFNLTKRVIRVVSLPDDLPIADVYCDVQASAELGAEPLVNLALGEKRDLLFSCGIPSVVVGAEIEFLKRGNSLVVEIRPKYRLPSGDEEAFYKVAGIKKINKLTKAVGTATEAQRVLPGLRNELTQVKSDYQSAQSTANTPTVGTRAYLRQIGAQESAKELYKRGAALEKQISAAQALSARLPILQTDLTAVERVGTWGANIADSATLSVTIHHAGSPLLAELR